MKATLSILLCTRLGVATVAFNLRTAKKNAIAALTIATTTISCPCVPSAHAAAATAPVLELRGNVAAGEQIFNQNCAACHAGGQNVIMPEKTLEKGNLEQYLFGGRNQDAIMYQVTNGKNAMPAFGGRLLDDDIQNVAAFVMTRSEIGWDEDIMASPFQSPPPPPRRSLNLRPPDGLNARGAGASSLTRSDDLSNLKAMIDKQQKQLDDQTAQIKKLTSLVEELQLSK